MSKRPSTIDPARLRRTTARNKRRLDQEREAVEQERERQEAADAEQYGKAEAQKVIPKIPAILKKAAREGDDHAVVMTRLITRGDKRAAEMTCGVITTISSFRGRHPSKPKSKPSLRGDPYSTPDTRRVFSFHRRRVDK